MRPRERGFVMSGSASVTNSKKKKKFFANPYLQMMISDATPKLTCRPIRLIGPPSSRRVQSAVRP